MANGIIQRSYYDAAQRGRQDAQNEQINTLRTQAMRNDLEQENVLRSLMRDPNTTPEQFARQGATGIAQTVQGLQPDRAAQAKEFATQMKMATEYASRVPPGQTKQFIERNFPFLAETYGPEWATTTDEQVRQELTGIGARYGVQAGIGPAPEPVRWVEKKGPRGSIIQENPVTGEQRQVVGPDNSQPNPTASGSRTYRDIQSLRKEFDSQQSVKDYKLVLPLYQRAKTAPDTRAGDISVIYALGKMFDPGSVVREGELVLSQNAAPWLQKLTSSANSQLTGEGALAPELRADILKALDGQVQALRAPYQMERDRFAGYANENGWQPGQVVGADVGGAFEEPAAPAQPAASGGPVRVSTPQEAMALPSGTVFITPDGRQKVRP